MTGSDYRRYGEFVRIESAASQFIHFDREKELLHEGLRSFAVPYDEARWILHGVPTEQGVGVESRLDLHIADVLAIYKSGRDKVRKKDFMRAVEIYRLWSRNRLSEAEVKGKLKRIMEEKSWRPRGAGLLYRSRRWYRKIKT